MDYFSIDRQRFGAIEDTFRALLFNEENSDSFSNFETLLLSLTGLEQTNFSGIRPTIIIQ